MMFIYNLLHGIAPGVRCISSIPIRTMGIIIAIEKIRMFELNY